MMICQIATDDGSFEFRKYSLFIRVALFSKKKPFNLVILSNNGPKSSKMIHFVKGNQMRSTDLDFLQKKKQKINKK